MDEYRAWQLNWIERLRPKEKVVGSTPARVTIKPNARGSRLRLLSPHSSNNYESELSNYSPHSGQSFNGQDISPLRIQCWFDSNLPYHIKKHPCGCFLFKFYKTFFCQVFSYSFCMADSVVIRVPKAAYFSFYRSQTPFFYFAIQRTARAIAPPPLIPSPSIKLLGQSSATETPVML